MKGLHHHEDVQCNISDAEDLATSIVAATFIGGNMEQARMFLAEQGYIPNMLEKSRLMGIIIGLPSYSCRVQSSGSTLEGAQ